MEWNVQKRKGSIINIGSDLSMCFKSAGCKSSYENYIKPVTYSVMFSMLGLTNILNIYGPNNVRVNMVHQGLF